MKQEFVVTYVRKTGDQTTRHTTVVADDSKEARARVEQMGNRVVAVVFQKTRHDL